MTRGVGIAKRGFGRALPRTGYADGGEVEGSHESLAPEGHDYPEASESLEPHYDESPSTLSLKEKTKIVADKLKKRLKDNIKFVTPSGPDLSDIKKTLGLKKGGSTNWIQGAIKKPGSLKKSLGVKAGQKIPAAKLAAAAKKPGKMGKRARLAQTLQGLK